MAAQVWRGPCPITSAGEAMLKISILDTPNCRRLVIEGKLIAPWAAELKNEWRKATADLHGRELVVDVKGLTAITEDGENVLLELMKEGARFRCSGVFTKQVLKGLARKIRRNVQEEKKMIGDVRHRLTQSSLLRRPAILAISLTLCCVIPAAGQYPAAGLWAGQAGALSGSVPSGPASDEVLHLTLRDAIARALHYNLATIESGQNAQIARGQRLLALSSLLPQVNAGLSENVEQLSLATFGLRQIQGIPNIVGPFSYTSVDATASQTIFSFESIQRFRSARTAEQAAQLSYQDILDVVTLTVGNAYLQVTEADSRIQAQEAQVRNAKALSDRALDEVQAGTSPRIEATRERKFNCTLKSTISAVGKRNIFQLAKLTLGRAIGLPLGQEFELADQLPYSEINPPTVEDALNIAYKIAQRFPGSA